MHKYAQMIAAAMLMLPVWSVAQVRRPAAGARGDQTTQVINDCEKRTNSLK